MGIRGSKTKDTSCQAFPVRGPEQPAMLSIFDSTTAPEALKITASCCCLAAVGCRWLRWAVGSPLIEPAIEPAHRVLLDLAALVRAAWSSKKPTSQHSASQIRLVRAAVGWLRSGSPPGEAGTHALASTSQFCIS